MDRRSQTLTFMMNNDTVSKLAIAPRYSIVRLSMLLFLTAYASTQQISTTSILYIINILLSHLHFSSESRPMSYGVSADLRSAREQLPTVREFEGHEEKTRNSATA